MHKCFLILITLSALFFKVDAQIIDAPNLDAFEIALKDVDQTSLVLFDVDETLVQPKDLILRLGARESWDQYAQETLHNPEVVHPEEFNEEYFLGQMLASIGFEVVDPKIVSIVQALQKQQIPTIAFTKMLTGSLGMIPSLEDWRLAHLKKHQLDFSSAFPQFPNLKLNVFEGCENSSSYKQGLLCANKQDKGPVLRAFLAQIAWTPVKVLMIDNRADYLNSVEESLQGSGINFIGFHYTAVEDNPCAINESLAKFQLMHLAKTGIWLSDEEALKKMSSVEQPQPFETT